MRGAIGKGPSPGILGAGGNASRLICQKCPNQTPPTRVLSQNLTRGTRNRTTSKNTRNQAGRCAWKVLEVRRAAKEKEKRKGKGSDNWWVGRGTSRCPGCLQHPRSGSLGVASSTPGAGRWNSPEGSRGAGSQWGPLSCQ